MLRYVVPVCKLACATLPFASGCAVEGPSVGLEESPAVSLPAVRPTAGPPMAFVPWLVAPPPVVPPAERATQPSAPRVCVRTSVTELDLAKALVRGHVAEFGSAPTEARLAGAWALVAHENERGRALWEFSFGNLAALPTDPRPCLHPTVRVDGAPLRVWAFSGPTAGAAAFWRTLRRNFKAALEAFDGRDDGTAVRVLADGRYFEAPRAMVLSGVTRLRAEASGRVLPELAAAARAAELPPWELPISPTFETFADPPDGDGTAAKGTAAKHGGTPPGASR